MKKYLILDLDNTIADLANVPYWKERLHSKDATPYLDAKPFYNMRILKEMLDELAQQGWEFKIISWLSAGADKEFKKDCRRAKEIWLEKYGLSDIVDFHGTQYGYSKNRTAYKLTGAAYCILIDDSPITWEDWHLGPVVDGKNDLMEILYKIWAAGLEVENGK